MLIVPTPNLHGFSIKFSPFFSDEIAAVCNEKYGLSGIGKLLVFKLTPHGAFLINSLNWKDAIFGLAWCETKEDLIVTGTGNGSIVLWSRDNAMGPISCVNGHTKEVYSIDWSPYRDVNKFISASWDGTVKLWDAGLASCIKTFYIPNSPRIYSAIWSALDIYLFASTDEEGSINIYDIRRGNSSVPQIQFKCSNLETLYCDWCKYDNNILASSSTDRVIRTWDMRNPLMPIFRLSGHTYPSCQIKFDPFRRNILASSSYDMTVRLWDISVNDCIEILNHHTEFVCGVDFNVNFQNQIADCSWDETIKIYSVNSLISCPRSVP